MPDLLLELFSEEIPARMQRRAADDLRKLVTDALVAAGIAYEGAKAFATPRRLTLTVHGLPARSPDLREERRGPRVDAPQKAIDGFLKSAGLSSVDQARVQEDKKGRVYVAVIDKPGRPAPEVIAGIVPKVIHAFPWPKAMRWGEASREPGSLTWVRPLHSILCVFGPEASDTEVVRFVVHGIRSGDVTFGHRFMAPAPITVRRFDDYVDKLQRARVVLDADRRKEIILADSRDRALALGLELVDDEGLLEEVAGLVEWPVVLVGEFDAAFLAIPPEVIRTTIRVNQKCFVMRRTGGDNVSPLPPEQGFTRVRRPILPKSEESDFGGERASSLGEPQVSLGAKGEGAGASPANLQPPHPDRPAGAARSELSHQGRGGASQLANRFILVANIEAPDGGKAIVAGNQRVIAARLSDAHYFWETDRKALPDVTDGMKAAAERLHLDLAKPLDQRMAKLAAANVIFHEKLGTQGERVERIVRLAREIAPLVGADPARVERAASLAKADLMTEVVGEFPELQGLMGKYYALAQGEGPSVAAAIEDHYKPLGPSDRVPTDPVAIAVALADKLDMLVGFWAIDEKPTGSKDPYALRRAALGVIRIVLESAGRLRLRQLLVNPLRFCRIHWNVAMQRLLKGLKAEENPEIAPRMLALAAQAMEIGSRLRFGAPGQADELSLIADLLAFFHDRLKVQLREQGARHDLVDAVLALGQGAPTGDTSPPLPSWERASPLGEPKASVEAKGEGATPPSALPPHPDRPADAARSTLSHKGRGEQQDQSTQSHKGRGDEQDDLGDAVLALGQGNAAERASTPLPLWERASPLGEPKASVEAKGEGATPPTPPQPPHPDRPADAARSTLSHKGRGEQQDQSTQSHKGRGEESRKGRGEGQDDLGLIVRRVEALGAFLATDDGRNLLTGIKRAANILREEEKKSGESYDGEVDAKRLTEPEERALHAAIGAAEGEITAAVAVEDFAAAMRALARLRAPVDAFFDKVLVNAPDAAVRANRLRLLSRIREATRAVADFSRIAG